MHIIPLIFYPKNKLRHLCPLNPIQTPYFFRWVQKWIAPSMSQKGSLMLAPSMCVPNMAVQQAEGGLAVANAFRNRLLSSSSSPCLTCSIYVVWNCLETGPISGAYFCFRKGDAASMWHILVRLVDGCREIWGSCAHLCGHSQPDFGEWVGVEPSMSLKMTYFLQSSALVSPHIFFSTSSCLFGT